MLKRMEGERSRILVRNGWSVEEERGNLVVMRDAPPLSPSEIVPWRMPAWTGRVPEAFWRRGDVRRSLQYSGSFAAWGRKAEWVLQRHDNRPGQGIEDHPLHRMMEIGGMVLLLGVDHGSSSSIHVAQWVAHREHEPPLPGWMREFLPSFQVVDVPLDDIGGQRRGMIGSAEVRLVDSGAMLRVVADLLREMTSAGEMRSKGD
jgi:aminoglycoside N3'-acetyltransferase